MSQVNFQRLSTQSDIKNKLQVSIWSELLEYLLFFIRVFILVALMYVFLKDNVFRSFEVDGRSMYPNYDTGNIVYVNKIATTFGDIKRGDVLVIHRPAESCKETADYSGKDNCFYIKRVVGLPGEKIIIENGQVLIVNRDYPEGVKLDESKYLHKDIKTYANITQNSVRTTSAEIPKDNYFLMGDNRTNSVDSREFGFVARGDIQGKEFYKRDSGFFKLPDYNIANN